MMPPIGGAPWLAPVLCATAATAAWAGMPVETVPARDGQAAACQHACSGCEDELWPLPECHTWRCTFSLHRHAGHVRNSNQHDGEARPSDCVTMTPFGTNVATRQITQLLPFGITSPIWPSNA